MAKILLADDHQIIREGIRSLLKKHDEFEIIGEAADGRETVELALKLEPDVVIMDISMPNLNGIDATAQLVKKIPNIKILALSMHKHKNFVEEILRVGASGYLLKENSYEELIAAMHAVLEGEVYLSSGVTGIVVKGFVEQLETKEEHSAKSTLTPREREILQLIAEEKNTKQISSILDISSKTVETHRKNIMQKLEIDNVAGLTKYAIREGLISFDD